MLSKLTALSFLVPLPIALACLGYEGGIPTPTDHHSNSAVIEIAAGEVFDAGWAKYDRGSGACKGSTEGGWRDAVFYLHSGATLRNVIIGKDQAEGVHCDGPCTLEFVWFEDVCEDAISIVCCSFRLQRWLAMYYMGLMARLTRHTMGMDIEKRQSGTRNMDSRGRCLPRQRQDRAT